MEYIPGKAGDTSTSQNILIALSGGVASTCTWQVENVWILRSLPDC